jgi:hypothetical protein
LLLVQGYKAPVTALVQVLSKKNTLSTPFVRFAISLFSLFSLFFRFLFCQERSTSLKDHHFNHLLFIPFFSFLVFWLLTAWSHTAEFFVASGSGGMRGRVVVLLQQDLRLVGRMGRMWVGRSGV